VQCDNELADRIAGEVGGNVVALPHNGACVNVQPDKDMIERTLIGLGRNPNVSGAIVVGVGCDGIPADRVAEGIASSKKPVELVTIEQEGSYDNALAKGVNAAKRMLSDAARLKREGFDISYLTVGSKCTGSTPASIMACNPAVGWAAENLVESGGTFLFSETAEAIGAEHLLARRGRTKEVSRRILEVVTRMEDRIKATGVDIRGSQPVPANIIGGMTTLEEKSLGAIAKSGSRPLMDVISWGEKLPGKGLYFMDGSANTPQMALGLAASGAQLMTFGYGGGLPSRFRGMPASSLGNLPILPVIKIVSSPHVKSELDYFDVYAGTIIEGLESVAQVGRRLLEEILAVASGKPSKVELAPRYREVLEMWRVGPVF
jgi:altronate dehydratase large subunit